MTDQAAILLAGPTASGKSALALALAEAFDGVVINADSMQVYRELKILTARPGLEDARRAPHRLYGVIPAAEACSAGRWRALALAEIAAAWATGKLPILVGGTGLYFRVLTEGLAPVPEVPPAVRQAARAAFARLGPDRFHAALAARDPAMAARLAPSDRQRLIRAYEVLEATGTSLADWQALPPAAPGLAGRYLTVVLEPPREVLYRRCDSRFDRMLADGALAEVRALAALGLSPGLPAMKALGVPELMQHLAGELDLETAAGRVKTLTRRYAKRQGTWFRNQIRDDFRVSTQDLEKIKQEIFPKICEFLLTEIG